MRTRSLVISLALSALAACNLYFGGVDQDHTPPSSTQDAGLPTPDGTFDDDAGSGSGSGSGCHTPDAGPGWDPDAGLGDPDGGPAPDAQPWPGIDGGCC